MTRTILFYVIATTALCMSIPSLAQPFTNGQNAEAVYGQSNYTTDFDNQGGVSGESLHSPTAIALDQTGRVFVADWNNHRVLRFNQPLTNTAADACYGQRGSFVSNDSNRSGISAQSLSYPMDVAFDPDGRMYIADGGNNRILRFDPPFVTLTASAVYGQPDFISSAPNQGNNPSAQTLSYPVRLAFDAQGRMYVADYGNNRVLRYDNPLTSSTADAVYGQLDFTTSTENAEGISANSLYHPYGVRIDNAGRLFIVDAQNNRVLRFDKPLASTTATAVYGQPNFTTNSTNTGGVSATSMHAPGYIIFDEQGRMYLCDDGNHRILIYDNPMEQTAATRVLGQKSFATASPATNQYSFFDPQSVAVDSKNGKVYVADFGNNRLLRFSTLDNVPLLGVDEYEVIPMELDLSSTR